MDRCHSAQRHAIGHRYTDDGGPFGYDTGAGVSKSRSGLAHIRPPTNYPLDCRNSRGGADYNGARATACLCGLRNLRSS